MQRRKHLQRGTSMVEFALASIVIFPLAIGSIDVTRAVYINNSLSNAARQGANYASINCSYQQNTSPYNNTTVINQINQQGWLMDPGQMNVTITPSDGAHCVQPGQSITVHITYQYVPIVPGYSEISGSGITLSSSATVTSQ